MTGFVFQVIEMCIKLIVTPFLSPEILWNVLPLFGTLIIIEAYFGKYKREELGWNSALANSLVLMFISSNLMRELIERKLFSFGDIKSVIVMTLLSFSLIMILLTFDHWLPKHLAFNVASSLSINYLAYIAIVLVYTDFVLNVVSVTAVIIDFFVLLVFFSVLKSQEKVVY